MIPRPWPRLFAHDAALVPGNHVRLLQSGGEFFPALIAACDAARAEIHLETYIFNADASTVRVRDALVRAARRGVAVRLLVDGVGARDFPPDWRAALEAAGVQVRVYRPLAGRWRANPRSLRRLHRKLAVIDARTAILGGMNLIDDFEPVRFALPRLDFSVEVQGPLLADIHDNARRLWRLVCFSQLHRRGPRPAAEPSWPTDGRTRAAFVVRDNFAHRRDIERAYVTALAHAREDILIASAYFLPGRRFRQVLKHAAARGVRVRLLVQGHTDHPFFQLAARALYGNLLAAGVAIHEYHESELHAKAAVVDGRWATVGSSNIDPLSLLAAREANLVIDDRAFAGDLRQRLQAAINQSVTLAPADWQRRRWHVRVLSWFAYSVVRWMTGLAGGGRWA